MSKLKVTDGILFTNYKEGSGTSGTLTLEKGHLYYLYVDAGEAVLGSLVMIPNTLSKPMKVFLGIDPYNHFAQLEISKKRVVTYQYYNINMTSSGTPEGVNTSIPINFRDYSAV